MSRFKVEFTLKQHTPMIHFQSEQSGATLRATELKPKFDRFLLEHVEGIPFKTNANGHRSLDYKVKVGTGSMSIKSLPNKSLYFGNNPIQDNSKKRKAVFNNIVKVELFSFQSEVIVAIEEHFDQFMLLTNFGTRQSKGFGSFLRVDISENRIKELFDKKKNPVFLGILHHPRDTYKRVM